LEGAQGRSEQGGASPPRAENGLDRSSAFVPSVSQAVRASGSEGETRMGGFLAARILDAFSGEGSEGRVRPVKNFRPERAFTFHLRGWG
jgi:hypothetical protein